MDSHSTEILAGKQVQLKALELQTAPLRGLDKRVEKPASRFENFYQKRIPPNYSSIYARIGDLRSPPACASSRVQYTQGQPGRRPHRNHHGRRHQRRIPAIMRFVNSLERDQMFFIIRAMALTGQQGGLVNLRLRVSTWLRPADAAASGLPSTPQAGRNSSPARLQPAKEGE